MVISSRIADLSTQEKASLTSGRNFWETEPIERAEIPSVFMTDGPHGVRKQSAGGDNLGIGDSVPATCFPPAVALGSTWDPNLLERVGAALAAEARAQHVGVLLGPGMNIKRSPLCGRNFEYFSEDPILSGRLAAAMVNGLQNNGVGASLKHFAANNQETDRLRVSSDVDERPLREIYLRGFEHVVRHSSPWTIMCAYNRINGTYAAENRWLLTDVLRDEWGYDGLVVSDWGAVANRVAALAAGLDLEMPSSGGITDTQVVGAVQSGEIEESVLDTAASRVLALVDKVRENTGDGDPFDPDEHHSLARDVARRSIVLLKNDGVLPLDPNMKRSIAVIGEFARTPRYQGAGSSKIAPTRLDNALDEIRSFAGPSHVTFAPGFTFGDDGGDSTELEVEAVACASAAEFALLFLGLPEEAESEGFDREDIELPAEQTAVLRSVLEVNQRVVVVLSNGSVVRISDWVNETSAIVEGWLLGQAGGGAVADVLFGVVDPSGRLAETVPLRIEDTPAYLNFPGEAGHVRYGEGLFVGYRHYDARDVPVEFPFGHGLSYTAFEYSDMSARRSENGISVTATVANIGCRDGREVVQVYVGVPDSSVQRPVRELKGFSNVLVPRAEHRTVMIDIPWDDLSYFDTSLTQWVIESGEYRVFVGASSRDLHAEFAVSVEGNEPMPILTAESTIAEWLAHPVGGPALREVMEQAGPTIFDDPDLLMMMGSMPLGRVAAFPGAPVDSEKVDQLVGHVADTRE